MRSALLLVMLGAAGGLGSLSCDPVHDNAVDALGPEAPGVPKGPKHRAGQPCITCHDGSLGSPPHFSVAGTIYLNQEDLTPAKAATVTLIDANNNTAVASTNGVGNFYLSPQQFTPVYPMKVTVDIPGRAQAKMTSHVGRDGSCADCHTDPAGPTSAGHIFIPVDGVTP
jgi:hypothetical protein